MTGQETGSSDRGRTNRLGAAHKLGVLLKTSQRSVLILGLLMSACSGGNERRRPLCNRIQPAKRKQSAQAPTAED